MSDKPGNGKDAGVGYGKPPKSGQFKPGQSGNPSGKKKGKSLAQYVVEVGEEEKTFVQAGKPVTLPANAALAQRLYADALKGKSQAAKLVFEAQKAVSGEAEPGEELLCGPEEFAVALGHAEWLKLIDEARGGAADGNASE